MRNLCLTLIVFMFMPAAFAVEETQQDLKTQVPLCQADLNPHNPKSSYSNSFEEDRRRLEPGPDEVEDRNPEESDALDPGGF